MCGIAGIISINTKNVQLSALQNMANALKHRGPNGEGFFITPNEQVGLAHRRLSIIDLSEAGNQPMHYLNRYTIVHNGEVYNYIELKTELEKLGYSFTTQTDTEVIVAAYAHYKEGCLQYFDGMFAFAIWDEQEQTFFVARDRFGEKPFYYFKDENQFCFASEMKALWSIGIPKEINHSLMCLFIGAGYTSIPLDNDITFYKNIYSLPPSHFLKIEKKVANISFELQNYWDIDKVTTNTISEENAMVQFSYLFKNAIHKRLRSDVALGTSLSGGLDSSSIVAFLNDLGKNNYHTFSAVFPGFEKDERKYIESVNNKFDIEGKYIEPTIESFIADFEKIITVQEQPFASSSIYAQYKVFELANQNQTNVLIDGQGADETIGGYTKYIHWYLQELFLFNKKQYKEELLALQNNHSNFSWSFFNKMAAWFPAPASARLEKKVVNEIKWRNNLNSNYVESNFSRLFIHKPLVKKLNDILYYNTMQFGLEDLLRYADKNAMAHGVEVRLPFLNHELVQFVFSLPSHYKIKKGFQKYILRKAVEAKLPTEITWRKDKIGYETPQQQWLQHKFFIEKINVAKQQLIAAEIINKSVLNSKCTPEQNWRMLIAAEYL